MEKNKAGFRALILETDQSQRKGLALALMDFCSEIKFTGNPQEGLEMLRTIAFDIIITELKFKTADGIEILNHIKQTQPNAAIIVCSAYLTPYVKKRLENMTIRDVYEKPVNLEHLKKRIGILLSG